MFGGSSLRSFHSFAEAQFAERFPPASGRNRYIGPQAGLHRPTHQ